MKHILRYTPYRVTNNVGINHKTLNENYYDGEKDYTINNKNHKALFLNDLDYTLNWVLEQNPEFETNDESARIKTIEDWHEYDNRISKDDNIKNFIKRKTYIFKNDVINYMKIYQKAKKQGYLTVYRQLGLDKLSDFNKNNIGYYWSFDSVLLNSNLSEFGKDTLRILITADIKFENINWENGLDNYIYFSEYESEIKIINDTNIKIVNVELIHYTHYVNGEEQFNISHSKNGYRIYRLRNIKYEKEANDIMRKLLDDISKLK